MSLGLFPQAGNARVCVALSGVFLCICMCRNSDNAINRMPSPECVSFVHRIIQDWCKRLNRLAGRLSAESDRVIRPVCPQDCPKTLYSFRRRQLSSCTLMQEAVCLTTEGPDS